MSVAEMIRHPELLELLWNRQITTNGKTFDSCEAYFKTTEEGRRYILQKGN